MLSSQECFMPKFLQYSIEKSTRTVPVSEFNVLEAQLAESKNRLDKYHDGTKKEQEAITKALRSFDYFGSIKKELKKDGIEAPTNAFMKMYEMVVRLNLVEKITTDNKLRVFCNAELPGAFVSALNQATYDKNPSIKFEWVASSLYPEHINTTGILGDTYNILANNPANWIMSADMRGDVTKLADVYKLAEAAKSKLGGSVDLYTSDAGIDVSSDYSRQEELTEKIHIGQTFTGFLCLRPGGTLIVKTFTFYRPQSLALLGILAQLFTKVSIVKPETSRPANSETYIIGEIYLGLDGTDFEQKFKDYLDSSKNTPLPSIPVKFTESVHAAALKIHNNYQISWLNCVVDTCKLFLGTQDTQIKKFNHTNHKVGNAVRFQWLNLVNMPSKLPESRSLTKSPHT